MFMFASMLQLQNISITQFRNYKTQQFTFKEKIIGICGANGIGKTNLLDAIYYLSFQEVISAELMQAMYIITHRGLELKVIIY